MAVKKLKVSSLQENREFRIDVKIISRIHHRYLNFLVRYYSSEHQRLLIYDYVLSNTLYRHQHKFQQIKIKITLYCLSFIKNHLRPEIVIFFEKTKRRNTIDIFIFLLDQSNSMSRSNANTTFLSCKKNVISLNLRS